MKYIPDYGVFIGLSSTTSGRRSDISYSYDGITWRSFSLGSGNDFSQLYSAIYNKKQRIIYFRSAFNDLTRTTFYKLRLSPYSTSFGSINMANNNLLSFESNDNKMLNIGSPEGKLIKIYNSARNNHTIEINNGKLSLTGRNINFNVPNLLSGNDYIGTLQFQYLNYQDLNPTRFNNYYSLDQRKKSRYLAFTDSSNSLNIHGYLNVNSITINGSLLDVSNNKAEFKDNTIGVANANKFIISKYGGEVSGINNITQQRIQIENSIITSISSNQALVDLDNKQEICIDSKYLSNPFGSGFHSGTGSEAFVITNFLGTPTLSDRIFYEKETGLLICSRGGSVIFPSVDTESVNFTQDTTATLGITINQFSYIKELNAYYIASTSSFQMSKNGYNWKICNLEDVNVQVNNFTYSPSLNTMIVNTNNSSYLSKDGYSFRRFGDAKGTFRLNAVLWVEEWSMFVGILNTNSTVRRQYTYSLDGSVWETSEFNDEVLIKSGSIPTSIVYSPKLNMCIASTGNNIRYTYNGKVWFNYTVEPSVSISNIIWVPELEIFISSSSAISTALLHYSYTGFEWFGLKAPITIPTATYSTANGRWVYLNKLGCLANFSSGTTAGLILLKAYFIKNATLNHSSVVAEPNTNLSIDIINNRVGLGVQSPQFSLHLGEDLAFKPTTSVWATSSDERLKEDIETANNKLCYNNIKNLKLKKYKWKDNIYGEKSIKNQEQLGWIAQDVESVIPKAVERKNMFGIEDCRVLNSDQIIANMFGAVKELIKLDNELEEYFE
jgi:hypothetical protein